MANYNQFSDSNPHNESNRIEAVVASSTILVLAMPSQHFGQLRRRQTALVDGGPVVTLKQGCRQKVLRQCLWRCSAGKKHLQMRPPLDGLELPPEPGLASPDAPEWILAEARATAGFCEAWYDLAGVRREPRLGFEQVDDVGDRELVCRYEQPVAAVRTAPAGDDARARECTERLRHVIGRRPERGRNAIRGDRAVLCLACQIDGGA